MTRTTQMVTCFILETDDLDRMFQTILKAVLYLSLRDPTILTGLQDPPQFRFKNLNLNLNRNRNRKREPITQSTGNTLNPFKNI